MKRSDLKKMLKPLIKECIKEVMFEDGILAGVIAEVARGLGNTTLVERQEEPRQRTRPSQDFSRMRIDSVREQKVKLNEQRQKLLNSIGSQAYNGVNLFEGTTPMADAPAPGASSARSGPLAGISATDSGVDISNLFGTVGGHWKAHIDSEK
jgi:hypothetical protein